MRLHCLRQLKAQGVNLFLAIVIGVHLSNLFRYRNAPIGGLFSLAASPEGCLTLRIGHGVRLAWTTTAALLLHPRQIDRHIIRYVTHIRLPI
uniref:Uncharacterized protein n=1 Tax=Ralstonia solanacearum TaxID=305 RepID=O82965_RALSL|nr:unnamed protein product [Ralstonia solanacearum]